MRFFQSRGVALKTERGGRVFPQSDSAYDITDAMRRYLSQNGVRLARGRAQSIVVEDGAVRGVRADSGLYPCRATVIATGGLSYPSTGSDGDGYELARACGHTAVPMRPSLVALESPDALCPNLQGLTLKNVAVTLVDRRGDAVYEDFGELLFTHFGVSGPVVLSASAHMDTNEKNTYKLLIDLKPALDARKLDARILRDFSKYSARTLINALTDLLHKSMIADIIRLSGLDPAHKVGDLTREQRKRLLQTIKRLEVPISGPRPVQEAVVTAGGVDVRQVNPKTMGSKLVSGLYFAGEVLDLDAYTGGFNLQIAWSTGFVAGQSV